MAKTIKAVDGKIPLRLKPADFSGLSDIVVSQLISKKSALAIFARLEEKVMPLTAKEFVKLSFEDLNGVGLSRGKYDTLYRIALKIEEGDLDLQKLSECEVEQAQKILTSIKGIGPWSAEVFLLFCAGHRDIFPAGDVALKYGVEEAYGLDKPPLEKELREIAKKWSPWRGIAARVIWAFYAIKRGSNAQP